MKLIAVIGLVLALSNQALASRGKGRGENEAANQKIALGADPAVARSLKEANDVLARLQMPEIQVGDVRMTAVEAAALARSLEQLKSDLDNPANSARVEKLRTEGMMDSVNSIIAQTAKFQDAAKADVAAKQVAELPGNIVNIIRTALDPSTRFESISEAVRASEELARGNVDETSIKNWLARLEAIGVKGEDLIRCR